MRKSTETEFEDRQLAATVRWYVWSENDKTLTLKMNQCGNVGGGDFLLSPECDRGPAQYVCVCVIFAYCMKYD